MGCVNSTPKQKEEATKPSEFSSKQGVSGAAASLAKDVTEQLQKTVAHAPDVKAAINTVVENLNPANFDATKKKMGDHVTHGGAILSDNLGRIIEMKPIVAIFPATSQTGLATLKSLISYPNRNSCNKIVCVVRNESKIQQMKSMLGSSVTDNVTFAIADFENPESMKLAFTGCDRLFLTQGQDEKRAEQAIAAIQAAKDAQVKHLVLNSSIGCQYEAILFAKQFNKMEVALKASGIPFTILQVAYFMENLFWSIPSILESSTIYGCTKNGSFSWISVDDIGRSAAAVLVSQDVPSHVGKTYILTSTQTWSLPQVAEVFSKVLNKTITYSEVTGEQMKQSLIANKSPEWQAAGLVELYDFFSTGAAAAASTDVATLTQGNCTSLLTWLQNYRYKFLGESSPLVCVLPASGKIGNACLESLVADSGSCRIRACVRSSESEKKLKEKYPQIEVVVCDFEKPETLAVALNQVDRLALIPPRKLGNVEAIDKTIAIAKECQIVQFVFFGIAKRGINTKLGMKYLRWELMVKDAQLNETIVRTENLYEVLVQLTDQVKDGKNNVIHHFFGTGKMCPIDVTDLGYAFAACLRDGPIVHSNRDYTCSGPLALTINDMCSTLTSILGRPISAVSDVSRETLKQKLISRGMPEFHADEMLEVWRVVSSTNDMTVLNDIFKLVGQPTTLEQAFRRFLNLV